MKDNNQSVIIALASDTIMLIQTFVTIASVLEHRERNYCINFFLLFPENEDEKIGEKFEKRLLEKYDNFSVEYIKINNSQFSNVEQYISYITVPTNYRLLLPQLLTQYDKCIYLDGDTYVSEDIMELWELNIEDNYVAGVVTDCFIINENEVDKYLNEYNFPDIDMYINAGVLLMNLQLLRIHNMSQMFMELINTKHFPMGDQDVINFACKGKIKLLSYKFNTCPICYAHRKELLNYKGFEDIEAAYEKPEIIHFAGANLKPWSNLTVMYADKWWNTAKDILQVELSSMYGKAREITKKLFLVSWISKIEKSDTCIILGFGCNAKLLIDFFQVIGVHKVLCCCDNNKTKIGEKYKEIECRDYADVIANHKNSLLINSVFSAKARKEIDYQVVELGGDLNKIDYLPTLHFDIINAIDKSYYRDNKEGYVNYDRVKNIVNSNLK